MSAAKHTPWKAGVHPFGGGYCVRRVGADGRGERLLSRIGAAPQIASYPTRDAAQAAADAENAKATGSAA